MKRSLIALSMIFMSASVFAGTALYTGEKITGMTKQCYYNFAGNKYTRTIQSYEACPMSIEV